MQRENERQTDHRMEDITLLPFIPQPQPLRGPRTLISRAASTVAGAINPRDAVSLGMSLALGSHQTRATAFTDSIPT